MTPVQKLKYAILLKMVELGGDPLSDLATDENIDELYDEADGDGENYHLYDAVNEVRCSGIETGLSAPSSRNYEGDAVAAQMPDGTWVGWTYWYGGGKHGEPESIDWMEDAYDLDCVEEEKVVTVRTFTKATVTA